MHEFLNFYSPAELSRGFSVGLAVPMPECLGKQSCTSSSFSVALPRVSILYSWLQRSTIPAFVLCAIFFVLSYYLLFTADRWLSICSGVARVLYFMALGLPMLSLKNISLGRVCVATWEYK